MDSYIHVLFMALVKLSAAKDNDRQTVVLSVINYERVRNLKEKKRVISLLLGIFCSSANCHYESGRDK